MIIARKEKKALLGDLIMIFLFCCLCIIALYRFLSKKYSFTINFICICLAVLGLFYLIKEVINFVENIRIPSNLIIVENDVLKIYSNKKYEQINLSDIKDIKEGIIKNKNILFYTASVVIKTNEKTYVTNLVKNSQDVVKTLNDLRKEEVETK